MVAVLSVLPLLSTTQPPAQHSTLSKLLLFIFKLTPPPTYILCDISLTITLLRIPNLCRLRRLPRMTQFCLLFNGTGGEQWCTVLSFCCLTILTMLLAGLLTSSYNHVCQTCPFLVV